MRIALWLDDALHELRKLWCHLFGHDWRFQFTDRIWFRHLSTYQDFDEYRCERCHKRMQLPLEEGE